MRDACVVYTGLLDYSNMHLLQTRTPRFVICNLFNGEEQNYYPSDFHSYGITDLVIVNCDYETRPIDDIKNDISIAHSYEAYGVYLDNVSAFPDVIQKSYLSDICDYVRTLNMISCGAVKQATFDDWLIEMPQLSPVVFDYLMCQETYDGEDISYQQLSYMGRIMLTTESMSSPLDAEHARDLGQVAKNGGVTYYYATESYAALPSWFSTYMEYLPNTNTWWVDTPRNETAGGWIGWKYHDDVLYDITTSNSVYNVGYRCVKQASFPQDIVSDRYESVFYTSFFKFEIPNLENLGTPVSTRLYLQWYFADYQDTNPPTTQIDLYYRSGTKDISYFPWSTLSERDYSDGNYTLIGSYASVPDTKYLIDSSGNFWYEYDVTAAYADCVSKGLGFIGFRLSTNDIKPSNWDWDNRPTSFDQTCWAACLGGATPQWSYMPFDFEGMNHASPWLQIAYDGTLVQEKPGELPVEGSTTIEGNIECVAADCKAKFAAVGTYAGSVWITWDGGASWDKIYEVPSENKVSSIYIDKKFNFKDYPTNSVSWMSSNTRAKITGGEGSI
jgi:hypothetical protein